ncbi:MAG: cysteine--tRNA ligase [Erysipelotrichaceae bacterium]
MRLYNSLTNSLETFVPIHPEKVQMYVCGPTVYNYAHIGNARPIVVFDTLRRYLMACGYTVTMASNYTDVDDKIIKKAQEEGVSETEIASRYIAAYDTDRASLHALSPSIAPKVTETMDEIIAFIEQLIAAGFAYETGGDVYFRVTKISDYGALSKQNIEDLVVGARIESNLDKENPLDFTLWKKTDTGIAWDTVWSKGRPGWHSECVVMIQNEFEQEKIDIHGGGMDLRFPHHENEIAQCEALHQHKIANYWLHNGMINIDGEKMSKSLNNVLWVKDLIALYGGNVIRWFLVSAHYRSPLNLSDETLATAKTECEKTIMSYRNGLVPLLFAEYELGAQRHVLYERFLEFLADDLNTPNAITVVFEMNKLLNQAVRTKEVNYEQLACLLSTQKAMLEILGIEVPNIEFTPTIRATYQDWLDAKREKDFNRADEMRAVLIAEGVL